MNTENASLAPIRQHPEGVTSDQVRYGLWITVSLCNKKKTPHLGGLGLSGAGFVRS